MKALGAESMTVCPPRCERDESEYVYDTGIIVLKVLEALEGRAFEPATISRVVQRTKLGRDKCRRALLTLKAMGWAKQVLEGKNALWILGPKAEVLGARIASARLTQESSDYAS